MHKVLEMTKVHKKQMNRMIMLSWILIAGVLLVTYFFEVLKGERTLGYFMVFFLFVSIPLLFCALRYKKKASDDNIPVYVVTGYFLMYTFVLLTGKTPMVFSYILPLLCFMILFHRPNVVLNTGLASILVNIFSIYQRFSNGELNITNSRDAEIQIALILLCFAGAYVSSIMYDRIIQDHEESIRKILAQTHTIEVLENDVHNDRLTGVGSRVAFDNCIEQLRHQGSNGVIFCDVNALKYINDFKGHKAGDEHLKSLATLLQVHFRKEDCFRISGDEFVVIISGLEKEVFDIRARRFYEAVWMLDLPIASIGWDYNNDISECIKNAEIKMYVDKRHFYKMFPKYRR